MDSDTNTNRVVNVRPYLQVAKMFDGMPKEPMGIPATTVGKESEEYMMRWRSETFREEIEGKRN